MFGQSNNTSFGGGFAQAQSSPFGQSAFGKTTTMTNFGTSAPPVFGSNNLFSNKPAGSTPGSLFGNTTTTSTFGASTANQSSGFGGFGAANQTAPLFGQPQNSNTNLFGSTNTANAFGQANKPAAFAFGQTAGSSLFGQPQQPAAQATAPFGQTATPGNTGLFGSTSGFGATNTVGGMTGTVIKFNPVTGSDTMIKNGVTQTISTRHHCLTCMKEYENKSLEELRVEDYAAGRKGAAQGQAPGMFGAQNTPFGTAVASTSNTANTCFGSITSGFGNTQPANTGLFSKPLTGFGAPATTSSAFAFNSSTSTNLFNNQSKPFGTATAAPMFGNTNPVSTAGSAFGSINTQSTGFAGFNSAQPNQSIGLFSQNKPTFSMPTATSASTFGFGQAATTTNTNSLFGPKPLGTGFGASGFGTGATSTFQTGTTGFGTSQNNNSTLFNNTFKPVGQTSGFAFGNTTNPTSSLSGGTGTSLFNNAAKPSLFGTTGTSTFNPTGSFGSMPGFGSSTSSLSGVGSNLFGSGITANNVQQTNNSVPVHQQILALVSAPFGDSPLLKNLLPASGKSDQFLKPSNASPKLLNSQHKVNTNGSALKLKPKVVSATSLSKKSLFDGLEEEDPLFEAFQPRPNAKRLVLRPKLTTNNESSDRPLTSVNTTAVTDTIQPLGEKENEFVNDSDRRRSSNSWLKKKNNFIRQQNFERSQTSDLPNTADLDSTFDLLRTPVSPDSEINITVNDISAKDISDLYNLSDKSNVNSSFFEGKSSDLDEISQSLQQQTEEVPNPANVKLRRHGYYTIPPLDELYKYVKEKTCIVPHFTIGRNGYGNVYFPDSFDIYGLNLDEIVHFRHKEVIIYPDDSVKPPVGQGLNRKAQVTLDRVWPHDKSTHEPITKPARLLEMDYEGKLRRVSAKHETRFLEYRPETGSWVFKVDHFSKYGLSDSDDDDTVSNAIKELKKRNNICQPNVGDEPMEQVSSESMRNLESCLPSMEEDLNSQYNLKSQSAEYHKRHSIVSPTSIHARLIGTESHTLQLMKASFFEDIASDYFTQTEMEKSKEFFAQRNQKSILTKSLENAFEQSLFDESNQWLSTNQEKLKEIMKSKEPVIERAPEVIKAPKERKPLCPPIIRPKVALLKLKTRVAPFDHPLMKGFNRFKCIADMGIQMGKVFRPKWGPQMTLMSLNPQPRSANISVFDAINQFGSNLVDHDLDDMPSSSVIQRLQILGATTLNNDISNFKISIEGHLNIQLEYSKVEEFQGCPLITALTGESSVAALSAHKDHSIEIASNFDGDLFMIFFSDVWKLCESLWGQLSKNQLSVNENDHETIMLRKEALSEWLKFVTTDTVQREIASMDDNDQIIYSLITTNKLEEACNRALKTGDYGLALLLSQVGGNITTKELIKQQINLWRDTEADKLVSLCRLKLYMLIAGIPVFTTNYDRTINLCHNLDWKRAFALHLWYLSSPTASITDVLELYEGSFLGDLKDIYSPAPEPEYQKDDFQTEINNEKSTFDLCYHLLKLYSTGNHPLEIVLNPQTYTYDPLDYRLSWMLMQVLSTLGYSHLSKHVNELIHTNFAAQLETFDLWQWAIFVVLHLQDSNKRKKAVNELLLRHVKLDKTEDYSEREKFLKDDLKIPLKWINEAKAVKACSHKRYREAAWYFIHAEDWNKAHEIIIEHLAADAIINEDHDYLKSLLNLFDPRSCSTIISGWTHQGQLIWDFIKVSEEIKNLVDNQENFTNIEYQLEMLRPQLVSLCSKLNIFPCPTIKHRVCQAEMAKHTIQLARSLFMLQQREDTSDCLVQLISQLPLPEDYAQQELRPIINICINEIIKQ